MPRFSHGSGRDRSFCRGPDLDERGAPLTAEALRKVLERAERSLGG